MSFTVVDVNGLNGSLSYGMVQAGGKLLARTGFLDLGRYIINANRGLWGDDWVDAIDVNAKHDWESWWLDEKADVVVAVPPCSGFSLLTGKGSGRGFGSSIKAAPDHPMNDCMWSSAKYAARHAPQVYLFESVTGAWRHGREVMQGLREAIEQVSGYPYTLTHWLHDGCVLGAPSSRQRYLFVCVRGDRPFAVSPIAEYAIDKFVSTSQAISDLMHLDPLTRGDKQLPPPDSSYQASLRRVDNKVDGHWYVTKGKYQVIHQRELEMLDEMGEPWGEGETAADTLKRIYERLGTDAVLDLVGEKIGNRQIGNGFNMGPFVSRREIWNAMHGLIAGGGPGYHLHPKQNRMITYREAARIQGWPDELRIDYDYTKIKEDNNDAVWGKAVMPTVAKHVALEVRAWLNDEITQVDQGTLIGDREYLIDHLQYSKALRRQSTQIKRQVRERQRRAHGTVVAVGQGQGQ